ncbi:MAG: amidohydrolase family protein [Chitinophagaceae bacterium]|nr:amidohydrolase family protein [Chitinophagaceae bacterium]
MKKLTYSILFMFLFAIAATAQDDVYPTPEYKGLLFITNGIVHTGNGQVLEHTTIQVNNGRIEKIGTNIPVPQGDVKVYDAKGKHVYPGLILPDCDLGLREIASGVRGSNDYRELGELNPNIRSIVSYNTDSKIINTLKANGILLANVSPQGSLIAGSSSVVQLDAWNWEDAAYKIDNGIHITFPSFLPQRGGRFFMVAQSQTPDDAEKQALQKIEKLKSFFAEAKSYQQEAEHAQTNLKFAAVKGLFDKSQKLFIHANQVKQMLAAIDFVKEFGFSVVIVGGSESWQIAPLLKQHSVAVILGTQHELPATEDEDVDQPYKTPAALQKAGVLFALNDNMDNTRFRNLSFNAGTAAAYGLTKEEALSAITLNAAKILGIDDKTGSLEVGKDANIVVSEGDILDMKSSIVTHAFIQGRLVSLANKQTQLYERYMGKYGLK